MRNDLDHAALLRAAADLRISRRIASSWARFNQDLLRGALRAPQFRLSEGAQELGRYDARTRELSISRAHVWGSPWSEVLETLLHEMAHQYAIEVLGGANEAPHGPAFAEACRRLLIEPEATATPSDGPPDRTLEKIRKLLALAESSNPHEARLAMAKANSLLLQYNLDEAALAGEGVFTYRRLGQGYGKIPLQKKLVGSILSQFFFVRCIWVSSYDASRDLDTRQLEVSGTRTNVDIAEYVHDFLHQELESWWNAERHRIGRGRATARREFEVGALDALSLRLRAERTTDAERGLVWVGDPRLDEYYARRYPRSRSMGSSVGVRETAAHRRGREVGQEIVIRRGVGAGDGGPDSGGPKLLPSRRG